ncbi:MAG: AAA family ATPase, partial [Acidimicrobiaceae bacterium]|nr:AAA family ATPase [Acidimicrobiaceae bacterium]
MAPDLFDAAAAERLQARAPLAARLRPRTLDEIVGQDHLVGPGRPLRELIASDRLSSVILWGPPGTGKTTLARVVALTTAKYFEELSAVTAGVKDVRAVIERARDRLGTQGTGTILFLDEVHRFNKAQQDALLPAVEDGLIVLIGATTENPHFEVNPPLMSRSTLFRLNPLDDESLVELVHRGLATEKASADDEAVEHLAARSGGDGRHALTGIEVAVALAGRRTGAGSGAAPPGPVHVTLADAEAAADAKAVRYGRDGHYD